MEARNKDFNIVKAEEELIKYQRFFKISRARFLEHLIECQKTFGTKSILDHLILLDRRYTKKTIKKVLSDLHYELTSYETSDDSCIISFTSTEG